jgi:hypothetical protein
VVRRRRSTICLQMRSRYASPHRPHRPHPRQMEGPPPDMSHISPFGAVHIQRTPKRATHHQSPGMEDEEIPRHQAKRYGTDSRAHTRTHNQPFTIQVGGDDFTARTAEALRAVYRCSFHPTTHEQIATIPSNTTFGAPNEQTAAIPSNTTFGRDARRSITRCHTHPATHQKHDDRRIALSRSRSNSNKL